MMRIFLSTLLVIVLLTMFYFPIGKEGYITIQWLDYHIEIASVLAIIITFLLLFLSFVVFRFLFWLTDIPALLRFHSQEKEGQSDLLLLLDGYHAFYQQDKAKMKELFKSLNQAKDHKRMHQMSRFYNSWMAQYYEIMCSKDSNFITELELAYQALLNDKQTFMLGLRGLIFIRLRNKRYHDALFYAEKALAVKPKTDWLLKSLIEIYMELQLHEKAEIIIKKAASYGFIEEDVKQNHLVQNFINGANYAISHAKVVEAIQFLEKALKIDPTNYSAVFILARLYFQEGEEKKMVKIIENAWKKKPNFEAAKFLVNIDSSKNLKQKVKLLEGLINACSQKREGYLALTELYIEENMLQQARKIMDQVLSIHAPDQHISKLMAIIENKSQHNSPTIANWLYKL